MKIGLIIYGSLDTLSGGYLYDRQLVKHLQAAGHQVDVLTLPWRTYAAHLSDNLRVMWMRHIARANYDILLQDELNHPSLFLLNRIWRQQCSTPIISIVHHLRASEEHPAHLMPLYRAVEKRYLRSVDGFIFNSHTTRRTVEQFINEVKPNVVAFPAADHRQPPSHHHVVAAISDKLLASNPLQLLFIGNLMPRKGLHTILNALRRLPNRAWYLHVVGSQEIDPEYSHALRQRAEAYKLNRQITWYGRVSDEQLGDLLEKGDLLVMPSYEGFGIVFLEAMAYGLSVIGANVGAAPEIITPGVNGYLCQHDDGTDLSDKLQLLLDNRVHLATLAYQARLHFEQHPTWQQSASQVIEWLRETKAESTR